MSVRVSPESTRKEAIMLRCEIPCMASAEAVSCRRCPGEGPLCMQTSVSAQRIRVSTVVSTSKNQVRGPRTVAPRLRQV